MSYQVKIISDRRGMKDFLDLPFRIYSNDTDWVPPLKSEVARTLDQNKNPYFAGADLEKFICYKENEPVARAIAVIKPEHWNKFNKKTAFFGFYESMQANMLLLCCLTRCKIIAGKGALNTLKDRSIPTIIPNWVC